VAIEKRRLSRLNVPHDAAANSPTGTNYAPAQYELSVPGTWFGFFGMMYPTYVRGMGYLDSHQAEKAAAEFQKIVEHRGFVASDPIGALARLQLARALSMQENAGTAQSEYRYVFANWKGAAPDAPIIRQANSESLRYVR
jgi:hypothetical protein